MISQIEKINKEIENKGIVAINLFKLRDIRKSHFDHISHPKVFGLKDSDSKISGIIFFGDVLYS